MLVIVKFLTENEQTTRLRVSPQTRAVWSSAPDTANSPLGAKATQVMGAVCPTNVHCRSCEMSCHTLTLQSCEPVTASTPSLEMAAQVIAAVCSCFLASTLAPSPRNSSSGRKLQYVILFPPNN